MRNEFRVNVLPVCTLAVFVLTFFSCNNDRIKREIANFSSCDVVIPEYSHHVCIAPSNRQEYALK